MERWYCMTASGAQTTTIPSAHSSVYATGCASGQTAPGGAVPPGFSNRWRSALASDDVGFHSATVLSTPGSVLVGTNVEAMNVTGKMTTNATPCTPSGVGTRLPSSTPTQIIANENANIRP